MMCYKPRLVGPYGPEGSSTTTQMLKGLRVRAKAGAGGAVDALRSSPV
jgi:hypothetical protein